MVAKTRAIETSRTLCWHLDPLTKPPGIIFANFFSLWLTSIQPFLLMHISRTETYNSLIFFCFYISLPSPKLSVRKSRGVCVCVCVCVYTYVCIYTKLYFITGLRIKGGQARKILKSNWKSYRIMWYKN